MSSDEAALDADKEGSDDGSVAKKLDNNSKDLQLPCLLDGVVPEVEENNNLCGENIFLDDSYYNSNAQHALSPDTWQVNEPAIANVSLIVGDEANCIQLHQVISPCVPDHEINTCDYDQAYDMCSKKTYFIIWLYLGNPASQEVLGLTTSIRYARKTNHNTIIIGVTPTRLEVDLGLHGIAEVVVEPIEKSFIISKYKDWTTVISQENDKEVSSSQSITTSVCTGSLSTDVTNLHSSSVSAAWSSTREVCSSKTNDIITQGEVVNIPVQPIPPMKRSNYSGNSSQRMSRQALAADHTTKEKLRRERIKDSCDQLRVLLPYIRGRKTDMASILEMTVDYLKLITTSLPTDFQNQIISMMGKVTPSDEVRAKSETNRSSNTRKNTRRNSMSAPPSPSIGKVTSTSEVSNENNPGNMKNLTDINGNTVMSSSGRKNTKNNSMAYPNIKRDPLEAADVKPAKRMLMTTSNGPQSNQTTSMLYLSAEQKERKDCIDPVHEDSFQGHLQPIHISQSHLYSDMDRLYSMSSYPQMSSSTNSRLAALERDSYGMFMDTYYHYYTGQQAHNTAYATNTLSDYVNPNAVLPVTYSSRLSETSRSYDETDCFSVPASEDVYISVASNANPT